MASKAINNTARLDDLILTLLVFGVYRCIHSIDLPALTIIQRVAAIEKKAMNEVKKIRVVNQLSNTLNIIYELLVDFVYL